MTERLARAISGGNVFERTETLSRWATSPDATERRTAAEALATGAGDLGALSAIQHLARDADDSVRAAAVTAAASRLERAGNRYGAIVRAACDDPSRAVRIIAIAGVRKSIELGHARGAAPALVRCAKIHDRVTQERAIDALADLAALTPRRTVDAFAELVDVIDELDLSVRPVLRRRLELLRAHQPRRVDALLRRIAATDESLVPRPRWPSG